MGAVVDIVKKRKKKEDVKDYRTVENAPLERRILRRRAHDVLDEIEDDAEFLRLNKERDLRNGNRSEQRVKKMLSMHDLKTFGDLWAMQGRISR